MMATSEMCDSVGAIRPHSAAEYALLGLLREGAQHGYVLADAFGKGGRLRLVLHLKISQMYAYLHKLERAGWISAIRGVPSTPHGRRLFSITPTGETAFDAWLRAPVAATRDVRVDFLLKLTFALAQDPAGARDLIARQRAATGAWLDRLRAQSGGLPAIATLDDSAMTAPALVLRHRIRQSEATLSWLDEAEVALAPVARAAPSVG